MRRGGVQYLEDLGLDRSISFQPMTTSYVFCRMIAMKSRTEMITLLRRSSKIASFYYYCKKLWEEEEFNIFGISWSRLGNASSQWRGRSFACCATSSRRSLGVFEWQYCYVVGTTHDIRGHQYEFDHDVLYGVPAATVRRTLWKSKYDVQYDFCWQWDDHKFNCCNLNPTVWSTSYS